MKVIFFGLGSIGRRHAKILRDNFEHELYAFRSGKKSAGNDLGIREVSTWDEVRDISPEVAFITNPTFLHIGTARKCANLGMKLFIEKPVDASADGLDELLEELGRKETVTYVAYNLRFHPVIEYLKDYLKGKKVLHGSVYTSSFLPQWRPAEWRYEKEKGGDVVLDLSHEFDYIEYLFGPISDIKGIFGRVSNVTLDAEDFLDAAIRTENTYINLHVDFMSRHVERNIKIDLETEYIFADLVKNRVEFHSGERIRVQEFEEGTAETYGRQLEYFLGNINNSNMMNNLPEASALFRKIIEFKEKKA